jgi:hypothetical protein
VDEERWMMRAMERFGSRVVDGEIYEVRCKERVELKEMDIERWMKRNRWREDANLVEECGWRNQ